MALGLSQLFNNIIDSVQGLGQSTGLFGSKVGIPYDFMVRDNPAVGDVLSDLNPSNWNKTSSYAFAVFGPNGKSLGQFELPLNPSDLSQDENPGVAFKITQGGTVVQHGGNRYKDLTIKGTTGKAPFSGAGGVERSTGRAIFQPDQMKYKSGYEVFHLLRNWFRAYDQWKSVKGTDEVKNSKMVFQNFKDGEFLVVELVKFGLQRNAQRKFLYDYTLSFRVIGQLKFADNTSGDLLKSLDSLIEFAKDKIDTARGIFLRTQNILRQVEGTYENTVLEPLRKASLATKAFLGVKTVAADMGKQAVSNTVTEAASLGILLGISKLQHLSESDDATIQKALQRAQNQSRVGASSNATNRQVANLFDKSDVLMKVDSSIMPANAQAALQADLRLASELPRSFYEDALEDLRRVRDNAVDKFNLGSETYDSQFDRFSTVVAEVGKTVTDTEIEILNGFSLAIKGLENLLAANGFFSGTYGDKIRDVQEKFGDDLSLQVQTAVRQVNLGVGIDLERLALQELGDSSRWVEIAELNSLKPPYIIQDRSDTTPDVLHPGDVVLIPAPVVNGFGETPRARPSDFTENLSEIERNLGVDLKLSKDFDLVLTNRGDLEVSYGTANAAQAIILKLMLEPGDLIKHPSIGVGIEPGSKFPNLSDIKMSLVRSLTQDPRFESVENLEIRRESSALYLDFTVKVKNVDIPVPITVRL